MTSYFSLGTALRKSPALTIASLAITLRALHIAALYLLSAVLPPFDNSQTLVSATNAILPGLRWDSIHFSSISLRGYEWEQQLAFQPLWQAALRAAGWVVRNVIGGGDISVEDIMWGGKAVSVLAWTGSSVILYKLTSYIFPSSRFALLTTLLYLIPPSPVPSLPYTEPLYALLTFSGLHMLIVKKRYLACGVLFAGATGLRATGVFNILTLMGFAMFNDQNVFELPVKEIMKRPVTRAWRAYFPSLLTIFPFLAFQWYAYESFCGRNASSGGPAPMRLWCSSKLPMVYSFVQAEYWNIGLFKYWSLAQLPNILLASPVFAVSFLGTMTYFHSLAFPSSTRSRLSKHPALIILYIHHIHMMILLLVASHTQIALRVCITDPVIWWNVASLAMDAEGRAVNDKVDREGDGARGVDTPGKRRLTTLGKWWIGWTVMWGTISTVLWAGHYPPA